MNPNPGAPPGGPAAPQQKSSTGKVVLIILGIVGGLALICCIIGGIATSKVMNDPNGKKIFAAMGKGVKMAEKGMTAPGTSELRKAGCPQAMVVDMSDALEIAEIFTDGGLPGKSKVEEETIIICQGNMFDSLPEDCGVLAKVYVDAVHPTRPFAIQIQKQGNSKPVCQNRYLADGTLKSSGFGAPTP